MRISSGLVPVVSPKTVFGLSTGTTALEILLYPTIICAVLALAVCLTAPRLLSQRP